MSNFFAALDDSGDEAEIPKRAPKVKKEKADRQKAVIEPSKPPDRRQRHDDRNTKQGRGRPPARDGKRTHDRRSGTGRGREIKKGGGGGRNWGSDKNEAKRGEQRGAGATVNEDSVEKKERDDTNAEAGAEISDEAKADQPEGTDKKNDEPKVEEPEDNTMSYGEYLKSKQAPESGVLAPVQQKEYVNEFAGKATYVAKKNDPFLVMGGGKQPRKKGGKKDGEKKTITPAFRVGDPTRRNGRDNRDRRVGRDRVRRGGRGERKEKTTEIDVADTDAFPTL